MKIAFIGGGSVWWTPTLVTDMALTDALAGATLVLHDIDTGALELLALASKRIVAQVGGSLWVATTTDRVEALRDADFVILCVSIGGLAAMRNDLQIPKRYGVYQSVGDTVGPGGLARGLRHIPFAVQVAREMEQLCPDAWLLDQPDDDDLPRSHPCYFGSHGRAVPRGHRCAPPSRGVVRRPS